MTNKQYAITVFSIIIAVICFLSSLFWVVMAKDLKEQVIDLKNEVIQLRWENENNYMCCEVD